MQRPTDKVSFKEDDNDDDDDYTRDHHHRRDIMFCYFCNFLIDEPLGSKADLSRTAKLAWKTDYSSRLSKNCFCQ